MNCSECTSSFCRMVKVPSGVSLPSLPVETADAAKGYEMALQIRAGSVSLNGGTGTMSDAPIGGYKRSGIGREYGPGWLREYQHEKSIFYPIGK